MNPKSMLMAKLGRMVMKGGSDKESVLVIENKRMEGAWETLRSWAR